VEATYLAVLVGAFVAIAVACAYFVVKLLAKR
jgi:hypothetical protein